MSVEWPAVTERVRQMVRATTPTEVQQFARHIGVAESDLKEAIAGARRLSTIKVIAALVPRGVDACYMLTGEVNPAMLRKMVDRPADEVEDMVKRMVADLSRARADDMTSDAH